uniref:Fibroblast growth factor n=1 Tax=Neogobius melanostomus TaxID=47308 RepID=A0A8C6SIP3_9GOBI
TGGDGYWEITTLPASTEDAKRLYCKNGGYFLRIRSDAVVDGIREKSDPHSKLKLQLQATSVGEVVIKGLYANRYLAMNRDGRLFGRRATEECYFLERLESNNYNTYSSKKYPHMYVALKRSGHHKPGNKTSPGQKAILFLPIVLSMFHQPGQRQQ